ncbi:hypothetical protein [Mucilaginibacter polytrichastri]|uniref:Uncharacterized protein n=1 Tax=Mucilaginibacter polytrichastri TaxID=1302689 RepID=A0A1Q6A1X2_9SPHI|nr:hypothetical protein [Mucilaginibacter polytrichastri]OKS88010.1 hypothetical protein RG47T_3474 [Mucilaginibacter polytrichastri]SFT27059.1 hypothetical protein SAMN04487890_1277 [Mucilaginibacter polytrichastri]
MKKILILLLLVAPIYCFAQTDSLKYKQKEEFCDVQFRYAFGGKYVIMIDDGHGKSIQPPVLKDANGDNMKFPTMVNILNYMAKLGWVLVTSYSEVWQGSSSTHLIYKREF